MVFLYCLNRTWENLTHVFIAESIKDEAKRQFGYSAVPYYIVFNKVTELFSAHCILAD